MYIINRSMYRLQVSRWALLSLQMQVRWDDEPQYPELTIWDFPKIGVPYFGVLIIRILLFRVLY